MRLKDDNWQRSKGDRSENLAYLRQGDLSDTSRDLESDIPTAVVVYVSTSKQPFDFCLPSFDKCALKNGS